MNKTISSLLFKLLLTFIAGWLAFGFIEENLFTWLILLAGVTTVMNYLIGDILLLPRVGSVVAATIDGIMAVIIAYSIDMLSDTFMTSFITLLIFGAIIAFAEFFFHQYLVKSNRIYTR